ncbi:hypothetical protein N806_24780 [Rhodococcus sp. P27]|nr:hypothetical protein N806_24780 [Rhodococcus sp. P27]
MLGCRHRAHRTPARRTSRQEHRQRLEFWCPGATARQAWNPPPRTSKSAVGTDAEKITGDKAGELAVAAALAECEATQPE